MTTNPSFDLFSFRVALCSFEYPYVKRSTDGEREREGGGGVGGDERTVPLRFVSQVIILSLADVK